MDKIKFGLEYGCIPLWIYKGAALVDNDMVDELKNDKYINDLIDQISSDYDALFINTKKEFSYRGFLTEKDKQLFLEKVNEALSYLKEKLKDKYIIEVDSSINFD